MFIVKALANYAAIQYTLCMIIITFNPPLNGIQRNIGPGPLH